MKQVPGTMSERGQEYVAAWSSRIAARMRLSPEYVAEAMRRAGHYSGDERRLRRAFLFEEPCEEVGALTPSAAKEVIAALQKISRELSAAARTHCRCCGLALRGGACPGGCQ